MSPLPPTVIVVGVEKENRPLVAAIREAEGPVYRLESVETGSQVLDICSRMGAVTEHLAGVVATGPLPDFGTADLLRRVRETRPEALAIEIGPRSAPREGDHLRAESVANAVALLAGGLAAWRTRGSGVRRPVADDKKAEAP